MSKRLAIVTLFVVVGGLIAQPPPGENPPRGGPGGQPGGGGPRGPGMGGPMGQQQRKILKQFDKDGDGMLNKEEREAARTFLKTDRRGGAGMRGGFGRRGNQDPPKPGPKVDPADVKPIANPNLYEPTVLRTVFLDFEDKDWEAELEEFHGTDVELPCTLTVDGKKYANVGVHFRGMSSYMGVPAGSKRSMNLSMDLATKKQRLYGNKTLNLLNAHEDPTFLSTVLYSHIARQYIPTPKANLVKVVINGESWGVYVNTQQFNKEFVSENYHTSKGARWKVRGNPGGDGGLRYLGDNVEDYKRRFEIKSNDDPKAWQALITLCKTLNQTPPDKLEEALKPMLDIDGALWFLALDVALINGDGYWTRASDYSLYLDDKGKFHVIPSDMNEGFRPAGGPGMGGPGGGLAMRMPAPGEVLPPMMHEMLQLNDEQKKQLAELQKDVDGKLESILSADQRKQLKDLRDRGPGGGNVFIGFGPGGGPGGPAGGGPGGPGGGQGAGGPAGAGGGGPGGPGGMMRGPGAGGGRGVELDPLVNLENARMPLRSKLLAVPALKAKYLQYCKTIAEKSLDWKNLGPVVAQYRNLVAKEIEADTRKLSSFEEFLKTTADSPEPAAAAPGARRGPPSMNLRTFADQRRTYLLQYPAKKDNAPSSGSGEK